MNEANKRIIKKYPNRRLYDTTESKYVTLQDIRKLVLDGIGFTVIDKKTSEDITRSILLQVIIEQEEEGEPLFSTDVLEQIIGFYGNSVQGVAGDFIGRSLQLFREQQAQFQAKVLETVLANPVASTFTDLTKQNLDLWKQMQDSFFTNIGASGRPKKDESN
jgi:polyhydroxyalkanoate synthesis repressor PhaR